MYNVIIYSIYKIIIIIIIIAIYQTCGFKRVVRIHCHSFSFLSGAHSMSDRERG